LPVTVEYQGSTRATLLYKSGWTTQPPTASDATSADIGGSTIQGLIGFESSVPQIRIRLRFVLDNSVLKMIDQYTNIASYLNTINNDTFLNIPAGMLICEGISMVHLHQEFYDQFHIKRLW
jgi:hypothetical protein